MKDMSKAKLVCKAYGLVLVSFIISYVLKSRDKTI